MLIQQPNRVDLMISFKSLFQACQNYLDQSDIDSRDTYNKSKIDKIIDDIRDFLYLR